MLGSGTLNAGITYHYPKLGDHLPLFRVVYMTDTEVDSDAQGGKVHPKNDSVRLMVGSYTLNAGITYHFLWARVV